MLEEHSIHHIHEFLPHLARRQPDLLQLLPPDERPVGELPLADWVLSLPQKRLMEICTAWVLESLRRLKERSPLTNVLLRGCLQLGGEFDVADAAAVSIGETPPPGDPRREEIRLALGQAVRLGVLIHIPRDEHYCIPFPVRLSFEGVDFLDEIERENFRLRMIRHFAEVARLMATDPTAAHPRNWRFSNILAGYEAAVDLMEELLGLDDQDWVEEWESLVDVPATLVEPLGNYVQFMGKALIARQSESGLRLLAASGAAARAAGRPSLEAECRSLIGQFLLKRGAYNRAIECYRRNEDLLRRQGDTVGVVLAVSAAAIAHRELGRADLAISEFLRARSLATDNRLYEQELDTANCAAQLLIEEGRAFEAAQLIDSVRDSQRRSGRRYPAIAELHLLLGTAWREQNRFDEARDQLTFALQTARSLEHRLAEARACLELARLHGGSAAGLNESARWGLRAKAAFSELSDAAGIAESCLVLARISRLERQETDCNDLLLKALRAAQNARAMPLVAATWHEWGLLRLAQDDIAQALSAFGHEVKALRHTRAHSKLAAAHLRLADLYMQRDTPMAAAGEALRAQAVCRAHQLELLSAADEAILTTRRKLTPEQFDFLVEEVTEELDGPAPHSR